MNPDSELILVFIIVFFFFINCVIIVMLLDAKRNVKLCLHNLEIKEEMEKKNV